MIGKGGILGGFASAVKKKTSFIDNTTFRLHYRVTFTILAVASILTTSYQFLGPPMQCIAKGVPKSVMDTYCWIHGTFTIPSQLTGRIGVDAPFPGVGPTTDPNLIKVTANGDEVRHAYYQWVCFVLALQAIMCYVPHYLWKSWEGGKLTMLVQDLDEPTLDDPSTKKDRRKSVVEYMLRTLGNHNTYVIKFVFCEFLNLVNMFAQISLMDMFLGGQFTTYGTEILSLSERPMEERSDPLAKVFPKVTKCTFNHYGPSGTIEIKDGLCVLAINIINEKIYIFLWFWFLTMVVWTAIHLLIRMASIASSYVRLLLLRNRCKSTEVSVVRSVLRKCSYGDWFLLMQMSKHIEPTVFHDLVVDLRNNLESGMYNSGDKKSELN